MSLNSDSLNYLVWRYLQESGFGHAAVKFQQYWFRDPQSLPFAHRVERRALVTLVNKGLRYHQIEQSLYSKSTNEDGISAAAFYFGPETGRGDASTTSEEASNRIGPLFYQSPNQISNQQDSTTLDRIQNDLRLVPRRDHLANGFAADGTPGQQANATYAKREPSGSPVNYAVNGADMDEEPLAASEAQTVLHPTSGPSVAIQSEQVADLSGRASMMTIADRDCLIHISWHPQELSILAAGGIAYGRLLNVHTSEGLAGTSFEDILGPNDSSLITSMAWSPDGRILAVAMRTDPSEMTASVSLWAPSGKAVDELHGGQDMVLKLKWNASGRFLLGITSSGNGVSALIVYDMTSFTSSQPTHCDSIITDAVWVGESAMIVCGYGVIGRWDISSDRGITWEQKMDARISEFDWTHIFYWPPEDSIRVVDEERAHAANVDSHGAISNLQQIHSDSVTAVSSCASPGPVAMNLILATSSLDGMIKLWLNSGMHDFCTLHFGQEAPPLAVAFNPEGSLLAAANHNKVMIWDTKGSRIPVAMWQSDLGKNPRVSLTNGHSADRDSGIGDDATEDGFNDPNVSLDWNADGKRLALGVGNQIAIINFVT